MAPQSKRRQKEFSSNSPAISPRKKRQSNSKERVNDSEQYEFEGGEKESGPIKPINAPKAPKKPKHQDETTFPDLPSINDEVGCTNGWLKDP